MNLPIKFVLICAFFSFIPVAASGGPWDLPHPPPADEYGNLLINRTSEKNGVKPAAFSHWVHRRKHTCRVCHFELEFNMKVNTTEITEAANRSGKYCGAGGCHDGKITFGHDNPNCERCHNGNRGYGKERFSEVSKLPKTKFGNRINWVRALKKGMIAPLDHLEVKPSAEINFNESLLLRAEWNGIPPAVFPHKAHIQWLDCNNCHPEIFNIKKKTTKHFSMERILRGEFCGVCHLNVAFPMNDCRRCHPEMAENFGNY
jgi:c(7)-type cytochrome triheme protein